MQIALLAVGTRLPAWVNDGFDAYRKRLPPQLELRLEEIPLGQRRPRESAESAIRAEGEQLLRRAADADLVIALDERGRQWSSVELSAAMQDWQTQSPRVAILVGGPDGLSQACRDKAQRLWSLSRLTLPHALVRVLVAEQIYRAWTILQGHPYHRS